MDAVERLALEQIMAAGDVADALPPRPGWMLDDADQVAFEQIMAAGDVADALPPRPGWMADALCLERPTVDFVPVEVKTVAGRDSQAAAVKVCLSGCLVRLECLRYAMKDPELVGVWGGLTTAERKATRAAVAAATLTPVQRAPKRSMGRRLVFDDVWWEDRSA